MIVAGQPVTIGARMEVVSQPRQQNRREVVRARHTEVIAFRSELLSLHCPRHPLLHALLPACADPQVFTRQDCPAYAGEPLHTAGLQEAAHQYSLQDMGRSTRTPIPTSLSTQEWQFKNLVSRASCDWLCGLGPLGGGSADRGAGREQQQLHITNGNFKLMCKFFRRCTFSEHVEHPKPFERL